MSDRAASERLIDRLRKWWRNKFSFKWVDQGNSWSQYTTRWQTDHAANVGVEICQPQVHAKTGETRAKSQHLIGITEPIERFDDAGYLHLDDEIIPPAPDTDAVKNPDREFPGETATVELGGSDE